MNQKGLTLTELIVASLMIGIVLIGVASFNYTVSSLESTTSKTTQIKTETAAAMLQIKKDAALAVGDITSPGVIHFETGGTSRCICFRQDVDDPASYTDDQWICYTHDNSYDIERVSAVSQPISYNTCQPTAGNNTQLLFNYSLAINEFYNVVETTDGEGLDHLDYVEITLTTAPDTSSAPINCATTDPMENPCYSLTTRVSPAGHSR